MIDIAEGPGRDLKNIRQIGTPAEGDRIYIENAAYARVHEETYEERRVFIFMGHTECEQGVYMTFVEAAIPVRDMEFSQNLPRWGTHAWSDVFREVHIRFFSLWTVWRGKNTFICIKATGCNRKTGFISIMQGNCMRYGSRM